MSYDPSHRQPPRQERWPNATPAEGWPSYRDGDAALAGDRADSRYGVDRQGAYPATAGYRQQAGHERGSGGSGDRGYQSAVVTDPFPPTRNGYGPAAGCGPADGDAGPADGYDPAGGYGGARDGYDWTPGGYGGNGNGNGNGNGYRAGGHPGGGYAQGASGYAGAADDFAGTVNGYGSPKNGYAGATDGYPGAADGYAGAANGYAGAANGYPGAANGYPGAANGYAGAANGYPGAGDGFDGATGGFASTTGGFAVATDGYDRTHGGYGTATGEYPGDAGDYDWNGGGYGSTVDGYAGTRDDFDFGGTAGYLGPGSYTETSMSDPVLTAPDMGVHPGSWRADQDSRREARQRGPMVSAVTELLGTAAVIGVSTLAAALLRSSVSPVAAMSGVFADRMPAGLRNAVLQHFGAHGRTVLLLGMFAAIAVIALVIGVLARRAAALGVAGIAAFTLFAAFVALTRPAGHVSDVMPAVAGGIAGVTALLWLVRASAPPQGIAPLRHARGGTRRRTR